MTEQPTTHMYVYVHTTDDYSAIKHDNIVASVQQLEKVIRKTL